MIEIKENNIKFSVTEPPSVGYITALMKSGEIILGAKADLVRWDEVIMFYNAKEFVCIK